jgi:hypothetical protein
MAVKTITIEREIRLLSRVRAKEVVLRRDQRTLRATAHRRRSGDSGASASGVLDARTKRVPAIRNTGSHHRVVTHFDSSFLIDPCSARSAGASGLRSEFINLEDDEILAVSVLQSVS